ncbi:MAG TPA: hypothetical protein VF746_05315 [Longimicrobium sp.]|jgi:hypothetical protein
MLTQETGLQVPSVFPPPRRPIEDSILVIFSVAQTAPEYLQAAENAVNTYERPDIRDDRPHDPRRLVRTHAEVFGIPEGVSPGRTLNTELVKALKRCVGAIAFVDDLRPNIAYELGFFHGKGAPVLLLTSCSPGRSWRQISDLAGAATAKFTSSNLQTLIHKYLDRLFAELEDIAPWPTYTFPKPGQNLLASDEIEVRCDGCEIVEDGPFGRMVRLSRWESPLNLSINGSLSPHARFKIAVRSPSEAHYAVYFELGFQDARKKERQVWLGLSSWLKRGDYRNDERNLPVDPANRQWRYVTGTFADLLRQARLSHVKNETLKRVRLRPGEPHSADDSPVEFGYLEIVGVL